MKKIIFSIFFLICATVNAGIPSSQTYRSPSTALVERETWNTIESSLKKEKVSKELLSYFSKIAKQENWGHLGYHGAYHEFRIYQDIIKFTIEEIVGISIRDDFHFLRIPGDPDLALNCVDEFFSYWGKDNIDNRNPTRAKQLLSMNFGIYSNYNNPGSCSACLFAKDKSKTDIDYVKMLEPFFKDLGISTKKIKSIFAIGDKWLTDKRGVLLQISENSHLTDPQHEAYGFADLECYPAKRGGFRYSSELISVVYAKIMSKPYVKHQVEVAPQMRLLINTRYTLNPFSHLVIKQWDLNDKKRVAQYELDVREYIRNLKYDKAKVNKYRDKLLKEWL